MTRNERIMTALVMAKFPEINIDEALHWIFTRNADFEGLSPADFEQKYGNKKFKKAILRLKNL